MTTEVPADFDPNAFMDRLVFTNLPGADELDVPPLALDEKITLRRTLSLNWDGEVRLAGKEARRGARYAR